LFSKQTETPQSQTELRALQLRMERSTLRRVVMVLMVHQELAATPRSRATSKRFRIYKKSFAKCF
jgi:hypothetical protein